MREEKIALAALRFSGNRTYGGEGEIETLARDIKLIGVINPIVVKPTIEEVDEGESAELFEVVAGRRRVRAVTQLGWEDIPCRILEGDEIEHADEIAGSENINRLAMHPLDEATIFQKLLVNGETIQVLSKRFDRKVNEIYQRLQLLDLIDEVKALFRNGIISLHAAAMLKTLDTEGQKAFCEKYKDHKREIGDYEAISFVSQRQHDNLYKCIADGQCETCKTRTFFEDKSLFPELTHTDDSCLNHECYLQKWKALLSTKLKNLKTRHKTHEETFLIAYGDQSLRRILGKEVKIDNAKYTLIRAGYNNPDDKPCKNAKPCFKMSLSSNGNLEIKAVYWKEEKRISAAEHQRPVSESRFAPAVKLLGLSKEETVTAIKSLEANSNKLYPWQMDDKLQKKHFLPLLEERLKVKPAESDIEWYLKEKIFDRIGDQTKKIFKLFMGSDYSEKQIPDLTKLSKEKLFLLLSAVSFCENDLPDPDDLENGRHMGFLKWLGVSKERVMELYRPDIQAMIPKPKAPPAPVKTETEAKPAQGKRKPAAKKPVKKTGSGKKRND